MDYEDYFKREAGELFSQLLMQVPLNSEKIFDAAAQCACYRNAGWKFHHSFVNDEYAYDLCNRATDWINDKFNVIQGVIEETGIVWNKHDRISLAAKNHCPVFFYLKNTTSGDVEIVCDNINIPIWQQPTDPWNIKAEKAKPSINVPSGKNSWFVLTVIPSQSGENLLNIDFGFLGVKSQISLKIDWIDIFKVTIKNYPDFPVNLKVCTSMNTVHVPSKLRNYMHVLPAGIHPFMHSADHFPSTGEIELFIPSGSTKIECTKGFEYNKEIWEGEITKDCNISFNLKKQSCWDLYNDNWISGDTHVHWAKVWVYLGDDTNDMSIIQKASDCHVISVLTLSQFDGYQEVFTPVHHPMGIIEEYCDTDYIMAMDEEYRNSGPYGHVNILGLKSLITPVSTGFTKTDTAPDYPDNQYAFEKAHEQGAIAMCSHGIFSFDKILIAKGLMDCVDQVSISQYYQILNCGFRIPMTVGTDSNARPMGKMRTYVLNKGELTYGNWIEGIRKGRTFVTNGPLLKFSVNGNNIGSVLNIRKREKISIKASAYFENPLAILEIVYNGRVILQSNELNSENEIHIDETIEIDESGWMALRTTTGTVCDWMDNLPSAHTSPIYLTVDNSAMTPVREDVLSIINELEFYLENLPNKAKFESKEQMLEVENHINEGIQIYKGLIS